MQRSELEHIIRASGDVSPDDEIVIVVVELFTAIGIRTVALGTRLNRLPNSPDIIVADVTVLS